MISNLPTTVSVLSLDNPDFYGVIRTAKSFLQTMENAVEDNEELEFM